MHIQELLYKFHRLLEISVSWNYLFQAWTLYKYVQYLYMYFHDKLSRQKLFPFRLYEWQVMKVATIICLTSCPRFDSPRARFTASDYSRAFDLFTRYTTLPLIALHRVFFSLLLSPSMDQISIKTPNPKCRLFLKLNSIKATAVYLSEAPSPPRFLFGVVKQFCSSESGQIHSVCITPVL